MNFQTRSVLSAPALAAFLYDGYRKFMLDTDLIEFICFENERSDSDLVVK